MRVVLFGAGASYGSGAVAPRQPPLGSELFAVLRRLYSSWRSVPDEAAAQFDRDFEAGMAEVVAKYSMAIAPLMQDLAVFFSIFGVADSGDNLYSALLGRASGRKDILWSTLNYECILETAAARSKRISYFGEPEETDASSVPVWKLHGSCNFKVTGLEATRGVSFGTGVVFGGGIEPINPGAVRAHYKGNTALYPAMALYAAGKAIAMSPAPIVGAQQRWAAHVLRADRVLVIGVHPNVGDAHIWESVARTDADLAYVGGQSSFEQWRDNHRIRKASRHLGATWSAVAEEASDFLCG